MMYPFQGMYWHNQFAYPQFWPLLSILVLWDLYWKGRGMWQAARNRDLWWFVAMLIINSVGILPIIYLFFFQKTQVKKENKKSRKK